MGNTESNSFPPRQQPQQQPQLIDVLKRKPSPLALQELFARDLVAGINAKGCDRRTPLFYALSSSPSDPGIVKLLLEHGADVHARDRVKKTPLHFASTAEAVELLVACDADVNATDENGNPPLFDAVAKGEPQVVEALVAAGAKVASINLSGESVMFAVTSHTSISTLQVLIEHGAPVEVLSKSKETPMHAAACSSVETVQLMIDHGVPIDRASKSYSTPLNVAVSCERIEIVRFLLEKNVRVHGNTSSPTMPLRQAAERGRLDVMAELVSHGASFDPKAAGDGEVSQAASRQQPNPTAMVDLMTENISVIQPDMSILATWMQKLKELCPMVHDATSVCEGLSEHLAVVPSNIMYGDLQDNERCHSALALVILRIWQWMLEYKEKSTAQRVLMSHRCLDEIDALHKAIYKFEEAFWSSNAARHSSPDANWKPGMQQKWSVRLRAKPEAAKEIRHFLLDELKRCSTGELRPQAFWSGMYLFALGMKMLRDQELTFGELILCKCTNPKIAPPECRVTKVPTSCAADVYLIGRCILQTLTEGKLWESVSEDVAHVLMGAGRLPPKPKVASGEQWQLVKETCAVDPVKRADMAHVVEKLRLFAQEAC
ncbi:hypothetical protein Gpo141_00010890 [Globisporangium polare]